MLKHPVSPKYLEKKVFRHIIDDLVSSSDYFDDSDGGKIKNMKLIFLEKTILKI